DLDAVTEVDGAFLAPEQVLKSLLIDGRADEEHGPTGRELRADLNRRVYIAVILNAGTDARDAGRGLPIAPRRKERGKFVRHQVGEDARRVVPVLAVAAEEGCRVTSLALRAFRRCTGGLVPLALRRGTEPHIPVQRLRVAFGGDVIVPFAFRV